jgi:hypothetical protein
MSVGSELAVGGCGTEERMVEVGLRFQRHYMLFQVYLAQAACLNTISWMDDVSMMFLTLGKQG